MNGAGSTRNIRDVVARFWAQIPHDSPLTLQITKFRDLVLHDWKKEKDGSFTYEGKGFAPLTALNYKRGLFNLLETLDMTHNKKAYNKLFPLSKPHKITRHHEVTEEDVRTLLIASSPKVKAIIEAMVNTGWRIHEIAALRVSDIKWDKVPVQIECRKGKTAEDAEKIGFLSTEAVSVIKSYLTERKYKGDWLFPGTDGGAEVDHPMHHVSLWKNFIKVVRRCGLSQTENGRERFHPHTMKAFNLNHVKDTGYPNDWAEKLTGRVTGSRNDYAYALNTKYAPKWHTMVEPKMNFLSPEKIEVVKEDSEARAKIDTLQTKVGEQEKVLDEFVKLLRSVDLTKLPLTEYGKARLALTNAEKELPDKSTSETGTNA